MAAEMPIKEIAGGAATLLTFVAFWPYIRAIQRAEARPHVFSWVIWGVTTLIAFLAQLAGGAGMGAWPVGLSAAITFYIALLAWRHRGESSILPLDWAFLLGALSALPVWYFTRDPVGAVLVLTAVDLAGFGPTLRLVWRQPREESALFYGLFGLRNLLVLLALEAYSLTTVLFPAAVGGACLAVAGLIWWRRYQTA